MDYIKASDDIQVYRKSSIDQHKNKFSVYRKGGWLPISYDVLDDVTCEGLVSHRAILTDDKDDLGYNYPEAECRKYTNKYLYHDVQGTEIRELPEWFGAGFYQAYIDEHRIVNSDTGALGTTNVTRYRIGLDYYQAIKNLPAVE